MYDAAKEGNLEEAKELLEEGEVDLCLPLYAAASKGHIEIVRLILTRCTGKNLHSYDYRALVHALLKASKEGHLAIMELIGDKLLLDQAGDEVACKDMTMIKQQALLTAARKGNHVVVQHLIGGSQIYDFDLALFEAARKGHLKVVKLIAPFSLACEAALIVAEHHEHWEVYEFLYENEMGRSETNKPSANDRRLLRASELGDIGMVKSLLDKNITEYCEPLAMAVSKGHLEVVTELITFGVVVDEHVLYKAISKGHLEILKVIMAKYQLNEVEVNQCYTRMLVLAVKGNHRDVVEYLLEQHKTDPELVPMECEPALVKATKKGNLVMVKLLKSTIEVDPQRSIEIATRKGYDEILSVLNPKDLPEDPYADIESDSDSDSDSDLLNEGCGYYTDTYDDGCSNYE